MHSYCSLRVFLCPVAGGHLCFVFAWGAFRVIGQGLAGPAAGGMLGGGASRGRGAWGVRRLDVLLVWKKLFNYVKEVTQRAAYTDGKKRKTKGEREQTTDEQWGQHEEKKRRWWDEEWSRRKGDRLLGQETVYSEADLNRYLYVNNLITELAGQQIPEVCHETSGGCWSTLQLVTASRHSGSLWRLMVFLSGQHENQVVHRSLKTFSLLIVQ